MIVLRIRKISFELRFENALKMIELNDITNVFINYSNIDLCL